MTATHRIELACRAKVNLALLIGPPLASGFHPLASWMVAVEFADALVLERDKGAGEFAIRFADDAPRPQAVDWPLEKDLGWRALKLLEERVGRALPVRVRLAKRIPTGAGLGGGSANAAGVLIGVNRLYDLGLAREELMQLSRRLGSDVAFAVAAMAGEPSMLVSGLGEVLESLPIRGRLHLTLAFPDFGCPTGEVYRAFDAQRPDAAPPDAQRVRDMATTWPLPADAPVNNLAEPAFAVRPELRRLRDRLAQTLQRPMHVTGSGSTLFCLAQDADEARRLAAEITRCSGLPAIATHTLP